MEALSSGLPVVATHIAGMSDIVQHQGSRLLVDKEDLDALASALIALLRDPSQCGSKGRSAQAFAREHPNARQTVSRLGELYSELIEAHTKKEPVSWVSL